MYAFMYVYVYAYTYGFHSMNRGYGLRICVLQCRCTLGPLGHISEMVACATRLSDWEPGVSSFRDLGKSGASPPAGALNGYQGISYGPLVWALTLSKGIKAMGPGF